MKKIVAIVLALCMCIGVSAPITYKASENSTVEIWGLSSTSNEWEKFYSSGYFAGTLHSSGFAHVSPSPNFMYVGRVYFDDVTALRGSDLDVEFSTNFYVEGSSCYPLYLTSVHDVVAYLIYDNGNLSSVKQVDLTIDELDYNDVNFHGRISERNIADDVIGIEFHYKLDILSVSYSYLFSNGDMYAEFSATNIDYLQISENIESSESVDVQKDTLELTNNIFENIKIIGQYILNLPSKIASGISGFFTNLGNNIGGFIEDAVNSVSGFFTSLGDRIAVFVTVINNARDTAITNMANSIKDFFTTLSNNVGGFFTSLGDRIGGFFIDLVSEINLSSVTLGNRIGGFFEGLGKDIATEIWKTFNGGEDNSNLISFPALDEGSDILENVLGFVPSSDAPLMKSFNAIFSNELVATSMRIVALVGVVGFLIFR